MTIYIVNNGTGGIIDSASTSKTQAQARADELNKDASFTVLYGLTILELSPARRWSLVMDDSGQLRADPISPAFGGGGYIVVPEQPDQTPPWEVLHA